MYTDGLGSINTAEKVIPRERIIVPATCKCGAKMHPVAQAPSYCGLYFYSYCSNWSHWNRENHSDDFYHDGHISDYNVIQRD